MEVLIQVLNGVQLGLLMFLLAAGLTLTFGIMDLVNLAHGSLYMVGAYIAWTFITWTDSFVLGALLALPATFVVGVVVEVVIARRLYARDHLDQVLATFGLILFFNELVRVIWGPAGKSIAPEYLGKYSVGDVLHCLADVAKIERVFGVRPQRSFDRGMQELISWVSQTKAPADRSRASIAELEKQKLLV